MYTERRNVYYPENSVRIKIGLLEKIKLKQAHCRLLTLSYSVKAHEVLEIISTWESEAQCQKYDKKISSAMMRETLSHG